MLYFGVIQKVIFPDDIMNTTKNQYMYLVLLRDNNFATSPYLCTRMDLSGSKYDYNDEIMEVGQKVVVTFAYNDKNYPIIIGGIRSFAQKTDTNLGKHKKTRFQKIELTHTKDNEYTMVSDNGPNVNLRPESIYLDDANQQNILIDKKNKEITINAHEFKINVTGNATIRVNGNTSVITKGVTKIVSKFIKLIKYEGQEEALEEYVMGRIFVKLMKDFLKLFKNHKHLGNLGVPTMEPMKNYQMDADKLLKSPLGDTKILSKTITGDK